MTFTFAVAGNGEIIEGVKISFNSLLSDAGDKIQFTFDDLDYIDVNGYEEDFKPGLSLKNIARLKN